MTDPDLEEEARFLLAALFSKLIDPALIARYVAAHHLLLADRLTSPLVIRIVERRLDAEAIEYALRRRRAGRELTRKLQILSYLAEASSTYHDEFVNLRTRSAARAMLALAFNALVSGWKLLKGEWLIRRHGLL